MHRYLKYIFFFNLYIFQKYKNYNNMTKLISQNPQNLILIFISTFLEIFQKEKIFNKI